MSDDVFSRLVAATDGAMVVVTAATDAERSGCLVGFHGQSSIEPERYAVWLSKANHTYRVALLASHVAVHFLGRDHRHLAERFGTVSGDDVDKFAGYTVESGPGGVPLLADVPNRMVLRRTDLLETGGDHLCLIGEPVLAECPDSFAPLRLGDVSDLEPGHDAEERQLPADGP